MPGGRPEKSRRADAKELCRFGQPHLTYAEIRESLTPKLAGALVPKMDAGNIEETLPPQWDIATGDILTKLSFSHMESTQTGLSITLAHKPIGNAGCGSQLSDKPEGER